MHQFLHPGVRFIAPLLLAMALPSQVLPNGARLDPTITQHRLAIARSGDVVHVVGFNDYSGGLYYARSIDGGRTWPVRERLLAASAINGSIAATTDRVFVGWIDGTGVRSLASSFDNGTTWQPPRSLPSGRHPPQIAADGLRVNVFCNGGTQSDYGMVVVHSGDGGQTWSPPVDLAAGLPVWTNNTDLDPQIVADGAEIHLFWNHHTPLFYLAHRSSFDGGATWLSGGQWIANAPLAGAAMGAGRLLVQAGSTLWTSTNGGATWLPLPGHGFAYPVALAMDGGKVLAVEAAPAASGQLLRMATSDDAGVTWSVSATTIPVPATTVPAVDAAVLDGSRFVRQTGGTAYGTLFQSDDGGATWRTIAGAARDAFLPGRDGCIVVSTDPNVNGLWAWVLEGHSRYGTGSQGTSGVVPTLNGRGLAGLGLTFHLDLADARASMAAAYVFGLGNTASLPFGASTLYIAQLIGPSIVVTGAPGLPGAGTATFAVTVPNDPSFVGARLLSQCFIADPGVPDGFCATAARESWIR